MPDKPTTYVDLDDLGVHFDTLITVLDRIVIIKGLDDDGEEHWYWSTGGMCSPEGLGALDMVADWIRRDLAGEHDDG